MRTLSCTIRLIALCTALVCLAAPASAGATTPQDPLFTYTPLPEPKQLPKPPPTGWLERPCGLAVDSGASLYLSDHYHAAIDRFIPATLPQGLAYADQIAGAATPGRPCALAIDSAGRLYAAAYHGALSRYASFPSGLRSTIDPGPATGVAVDPTTNDVYVDDGDHVSIYQPSGAPVEVSGQPLLIGAASLGEGYGIAVSGYPATAGFLYVPDAATETVKVYDPGADTEAPVAAINGPGGGFSSLADAAIAVDGVTGEIYVADDLQPETADYPEAAIYVFDHTGVYEGRLKYNVVDARPPGLAVDNTVSGTQGRVYVTSGNTERSSVIGYGPGSAGPEAAPPPEVPEALPPGVCACGVLPEPPPPMTCEGDSCQHLPSEPTDPTLNTLIEGAANPPLRFHDTNRLAHYRRLRHHHRGRPGDEGVPPSRSPRHTYRGKTAQKLEIRFASASGKIEPIRFKAQLLCRDGSLLHADLSDFEASPLSRGGRFSESQRGPTDTVSWRGRLQGSKISGSLRVKDRLESGVRCDSGPVGFGAKRVG